MTPAARVVAVAYALRALGGPWCDAPYPAMLVWLHHAWPAAPAIAWWGSLVSLVPSRLLGRAFSPATGHVATFCDCAPR